MIIGIAGTFASGKGAVVEYLKSKGFAHYSSSDRLKEILTERGQPHGREYLSAVAEELMSETPGGVLGLSMQRSEKEGKKDVVLEAIHRMHEADFVRSQGGKILGIDADIKTRYERTIARQDGAKDAVTFEEFKEHIEREEEGKRDISSNIKAVIASADAVIENNGSLEELHVKVDDVLKKF